MSVNKKITPVSFRDSHLSLNLIKVSTVFLSASLNLHSSPGRGDFLLKGMSFTSEYGHLISRTPSLNMHIPTVNRELHQEIDALHQ